MFARQSVRTSPVSSDTREENIIRKEVDEWTIRRKVTDDVSREENIIRKEVDEWMIRRIDIDDCVIFQELLCLCISTRTRQRKYSQKKG